MLEFTGSEDNLKTQIAGYFITTFEDGRIWVGALNQTWFADSVEEAKTSLQKHYAKLDKSKGRWI